MKLLQKIFNNESNNNPNIEKLALFTGFFSCHSIWSVEDGSQLCPIYAYEKGGKRKMERFEGEDYQQVVEKMKQVFHSEFQNYEYSFVSYDGYLTLNNMKKDAIMIEFMDSNKNAGTMAIPYNHSNNEKGFIVYRPKILDSNIKDLDLFTQKFFEGIDSHTKGAEVWNSHLDQSE
jgi:hypothetical protein